MIGIGYWNNGVFGINRLNKKLLVQIGFVLIGIFYDILLYDILFFFILKYDLKLFRM